MEETKQTLDLTRFNRKERRNIAKQIKTKIPGRNLPFLRETHKTLSNFYELREKELEIDKPKTNA